MSSSTQSILRLESLRARRTKDLSSAAGTPLSSTSAGTTAAISSSRGAAQPQPSGKSTKTFGRKPEQLKQAVSAVRNSRTRARTPGAATPTTLGKSAGTATTSVSASPQEDTATSTTDEPLDDRAERICSRKTSTALDHLAFDVGSHAKKANVTPAASSDETIEQQLEAWLNQCEDETQDAEASTRPKSSMSKAESSPAQEQDEESPKKTISEQAVDVELAQRQGAPGLADDEGANSVVQGNGTEADTEAYSSTSSQQETIQKDAEPEQGSDQCSEVKTKTPVDESSQRPASHVSNVRGSDEADRKSGAASRPTPRRSVAATPTPLREAFNFRTELARLPLDRQKRVTNVQVLGSSGNLVHFDIQTRSSTVQHTSMTEEERNEDEDVSTSDTSSSSPRKASTSSASFVMRISHLEDYPTRMDCVSVQSEGDTVPCAGVLFRVWSSLQQSINVYNRDDYAARVVDALIDKSDAVYGIPRSRNQRPNESASAAPGVSDLHLRGKKSKSSSVKTTLKTKRPPGAAIQKTEHSEAAGKGTKSRDSSSTSSSTATQSSSSSSQKKKSSESTSSKKLEGEKDTASDEAQSRQTKTALEEWLRTGESGEDLTQTVSSLADLEWAELRAIIAAREAVHEATHERYVPRQRRIFDDRGNFIEDIENSSHKTFVDGRSEKADFDRSDEGEVETPPGGAEASQSLLETKESAID
ncbi:unnamed protein product [Amoebophrya sp. A25]|nr:unnamed protein product [Amoebophrya sp. A25]|eukprot:GSA25T00021652001.1